MAVTVSETIPAMDLTLGCMFIGLLINVFLYGMSVVQGYMYFVNFKSDKLFMRVFVAVLLVADTLNCVLDCGFMYQYLVSNFGNLEYAARANDMFASDPVLTSIIALACQTFFAWRVYRLMHSWIVPGVILLFSVVSFLSAIGTTIGVEIVQSFALFQKFQVVVILWLACAAIADIIITTSLVWTLQKSRTGFSATDDVITRLIRGTIQTGMATTIFAVTDLILFCASTTTLHLVFNLPLAKLYVNSLLSTLNARALIAKSQRQHSGEGLSDGVRSKQPGAGRHARFESTSGQDTISSPTSRGFKKSLGFGSGAQPRFDIEQGIQVTTVEERYEEPHHPFSGGAHRRFESREMTQMPELSRANSQVPLNSDMRTHQSMDSFGDEDKSHMSSQKWLPPRAI